MALQIKIEGNKIFAPLKNQWIVLTDEEKIKQEFICRLVNSYHYTLEQLGQDIEIKEQYKADIAVWKSAVDKQENEIPSIIIAIECKAEHIKIKESDYSAGYNFASFVNANFFIAANQKETKVYHLSRDSSFKNGEKMAEIPNAEIIADEKKIEKYIKDSRTFTKEEFLKLLTRCHNIIRNNDKLSPEAAFDEISKILFIKIMHERNSKEEMLFTKAKVLSGEKIFEKEQSTTTLDINYIQHLFDQTKLAFENDEIFDSKDQIKIKRNSFDSIVEEMEAFNLSDTSDDIKGIAFEQFLGKTFRGELGQFFTPRTVVDYMVEILDPKEGELICDPCCGSGGFLITAFEYIKNKIDEDIRKQIHSLKNEISTNISNSKVGKKEKEFEKEVQNRIKLLNEEFDLKKSGSRYYNLSHNCIFGTDANPRMARIAKMNMIMHGDGHGGVHHHDGLLNVNGIFEGRFDIILTNPPFGSRIEKGSRVSSSDLPSEEKQRKYINKYGEDYIKHVLDPIMEWISYSNGEGKPKGKPILDLFETGSMSGLTEVLFIERCLNLLKDGGKMGIVLPEGIMNNSALQKIRDFVEGKAKILNITSIPQDVFLASGATIKPSLLFLQKFRNEDRMEYEKAKIGGVLHRGSFNYEMIITDIKDAGITPTGSYSENNQFPKAIEEYKIYSKNLPHSSFELIKIANFEGLVNWSVAHIQSQLFSKTSIYNSIKLADFLSKNNSSIKINDDIVYKRITIRINNNGISLRDTEIGRKIGTKRQFVISQGQFAISKIDARNGAMGIIPAELEGAVVTPDFLTFNINQKIILPEYLELVTSTKEFTNFCKSFSSGSTNRQRLNETLFLNASIPVPPLDKQKEMVSEISKLKVEISQAEKQLQEAKEKFEKDLFKS